MQRDALTHDEKDFNAAVTSAKSAGAGAPLTTPFTTLFSNQGKGMRRFYFLLITM